jgi:O-antigen ligase
MIKIANQGLDKTLTHHRTRSILAYVPFIVPLIYLYPFLGAFNSELWHSAIVIVAGLVCGTYLALNVSITKRPSIWAFSAATLLFIMLASSLLSTVFYRSMFGIRGDYQGLLEQAASLVIGYFASLYCMDKQYWHIVANLCGLICIGSVLTGAHDVWQGYRLAGFFIHDTGMSLFAVISLGINLLALQTMPKILPRTLLWRYSCIAASLLAIILSASRIGLFACLVVLLLLYLKLSKLRRGLLVVMCVLVLAVAIGSVLTSPIQRLTHPAQVNEGISYRLQLYRWSYKVSKPSFIGGGASSVAVVLQPHATIRPSPAIAQTFRTGYPLWYAHNQFIDTYIEYGIIGFLLLGGLVIGSCVKVIHALRISDKLAPEARYQTLIISVLLIVVVCDLTVNTPSIELASIVYLGIFGGLKLRNQLSSE